MSAVVTHSAPPARRIALGTVQFGLDYGIANATGKVSMTEIGRILEAASSAGVDTLDTAINYGDAEACLGELGVTDWRIVSKLPGVPKGTKDVESWVLQEVEGSLKRLRVPALYALLLHRPADLSGPLGDALARGLSKLKAEGLAEKVGVSVYGPDEIRPLLGQCGVDVIQAPFNVLDRRTLAPALVERFETESIEIHTRSAFLQGLLLMSQSDRPSYFDQWSDLWLKWHSWLEAEGLAPVRAALGFALSQAGSHRVVVGVDSLSQLKDVLAVASEPNRAPPESLSIDDEALLNPSRWPAA